MTRIRGLLAVLTVAIACGQAQAQAPGRSSVVVRFKDDVGPRTIETWLAAGRADDLRVDYRFHTFPAVLVSMPADKIGLIDRLANDPVVEYVGGDRPVVLDEMPDDPLFPDQYWAHSDGSQVDQGTDVDAPRAWDIGTGSRDVVVAVVDHGVDTSHPDLADNCLPGYDFVAQVPGTPPHFHGTGIAGLIGAVGDNALGVAGVNWDVTIVPFSFYYVSEAAAAIDSAVTMGVDVINNSWTISYNPYHPYDLLGLSEAISAAMAAGVIVVNGAGNNGWDLDLPGQQKYPASYNLPLNLAVASCSSNSLMADSSNWGLDTIELAAFGVQMMTCAPDSGYTARSGTSFAAPLVAGAAALLISEYPDAAPAWIVDRLIDSAERLHYLSDKVPEGRRLNLFRALNTDDRTPPADVADLRVSDIDFDRATVSWTASGDDGMTGHLDRYEIWAEVPALEALSQILVDTVPVAPGQTQVVELVDLLYGREYILRVIAVDDDRNRSDGTVVTFTALAPPQIAVPDNFRLTRVTAGGTAEEPVWIHNHGAGTLDVSVTGLGPHPWLSVVPAELAVAGHDSAQIVLVIDASGRCGPSLVASLQITHNDPALYPLPFTLAAMIDPAPEISGPEGGYDFGAVPPHAITTGHVSIRNIGCEDLSIEGFSLRSRSPFSVAAAPKLVEPGGSSDFVVMFEANVPGEYRDTLLIESNSPFMGMLAIELSGVCDPDPQGGRRDEAEFACMPNPFNPRTEFSFTAATDGRYRVGIYDARGALVRRLEGLVEAGRPARIAWNGTDDAGAAAPSGVYFCTLQVDGRRAAGTLKVHLVR